MNLKQYILAIALALSMVLPARSAEAANQDSEASAGAAAQPASNCPNIATQWYAVGSVPAGYYKSNADGNCYPISCAGGTQWSSTAQTCVNVCASNMVWNGSGCSCPPGSPNWDGSGCVAACPAGSTWNGAGCSPNSCSATNGTSGPCMFGFPSTASGSSYTAANTTSGYTGSATASCTSGAWSTSSASCAANSCAAQGVASGGCSYTLPTTASGSTGSASNVAAGYSGSVTATCSAGAWGGISANCVAQPPVISLNVNGGTAATTVKSGSGIPLAWSATNSPSNISISCGALGSWSGATNPGASVTPATTDAEVGAGQQNCVATASNAGGTASSNSVPLIVVCPSSTYYDATAHVCAALPFSPGGAGNPGTFGYFSPRIGAAGQQQFQILSNGTWAVSRSGFPAAGLMTTGTPTSGTWTTDPSQAYEYTVTQAASLVGNAGTVSPMTTTTTWTTLSSLTLTAKTPGGGTPEGDGRWTVNIRKKGTTSPVLSITVELDTANGD